VTATGWAVGRSRLSEFRLQAARFHLVETVGLRLPDLSPESPTPATTGRSRYFREPAGFRLKAKLPTKDRAHSPAGEVDGKKMVGLGVVAA